MIMKNITISVLRGIKYHDEHRLKTSCFISRKNDREKQHNKKLKWNKRP
jgi:hypothetical protein